MNDDIMHFDNLLPKGYANQLLADITNFRFPWTYVSDVTYEHEDNNPGFAHASFDAINNVYSDYLPFFKPMIYSMEEASGKPINQLLRIRVGMLLNMGRDIPNSPHIDFVMSHYTCCYYVNDSDGDTIVYDQRMKPGETSEETKTFSENNKFTIADRGPPVFNSACFFDGTRYHASSYPRVHNKRIVITVNYQ